MATEDQLRRLLSENADLRARERGGVAPPPGGPHDPGMDARVRALEDGQKALLDGQQSIKDALEKLRDGQQKALVELAELKGRVSQLPTTLQMIGFVVVVLGIAGVSRWLGR